MNWLTTAILAIIFLSAYNFVLKLTSDKISNFYGVPFIATGILIIGVVGLFLSKIFHLQLIYTKTGALLALLAGLLYGTGLMFCYFMYAKNIPLSTGMPILIGGTILLGTLLGIIFLNEPLTMAKAGGIGHTSGNNFISKINVT